MQQKINAEKFEGPKMADILGQFYFNNHWTLEKSPHILIGKNGSKTAILKVDSTAPVSGSGDEIKGGKNENPRRLFVLCWRYLGSTIRVSTSAGDYSLGL